MLRLIAPALVLSSGCVVSDVDIPFDFDEDGLLLEDQWGTDPDDPDSDGDGHLDGAEVDAGADPMDSDDHPYIGGWELDSCRHDIEGTGYDVGDIAMDFRIPDQHGEALSLHDFCGKAILIEGSGFT